LQRETLSDQVARHLLLSIKEKGMKPGELLPSMTQLGQDYGVSLPVVREALRSLSALGIILVSKGKGAIVRPFDDQLLRVFFSQAIRLESQPLTKLLEVRQPLEMQSARLAAVRRTERDLEKLEALISDMRSNLPAATRYIYLDTEFHLAIAAATHNVILSFLVLSSRSVVEDAMIKVRRKREELGLVGTEQKAHETIFEAIRKQAMAEAGVAMQAHLQETFDLVKQIEIQDADDAF
jgi:GntR family transcriptional repressor for pyruvate dehydrogenase complex